MTTIPIPPSSIHFWLTVKSILSLFWPVATRASSGISIMESNSISPSIQTYSTTFGGAGIEQSVGSIDSVGYAVGVKDDKELGPSDGTLLGVKLGLADEGKVGLPDASSLRDKLGLPDDKELGPSVDPALGSELGV